MGKIIGIFGGDSQVGTTMIAQSVSEYLGSSGKEVLLINGSGKYGEEFMNTGTKYSVDDLKANIMSGIVTFEDINQVITRNRNIMVMPSVRNPFSAKYYPENTFEIMLSSITDDFDYIVIDAGDNMNLGMTVSALNTADIRYFVTTQQSKSIHRFLQVRSDIIEPLGLEFDIILNKYIKEPSLFLKKDVESLCEVTDIKTVPYIEYGWQMEMEGRTLMHFSRFAKAIEAVAGQFESGERREKLWKKSFA